MATAPKNSTSDDGRSLLECPVCVSTFRNPKSLRCGHSVCFECCQQLRNALYVVCPVCRTKTQIPAEGLPTNFALQDLIEHHVTQRQGQEEVGNKKYGCSSCERRHLIEESWICSTCNSTLICANCAIKDHRGHDLQMVSDLISRRREELTDWRQRMEGVVREVDGRQRQIDANLVRIEQRSIQLNATLRTKLEPRLAESFQELNAEREALFKAINDVDVSDIVGTPSNDGAAHAHSQFQNQLNEVPQKLDALKSKQEQLLADQRLALEVVQNCNEVLRQMVSNSPKKNTDGDRQTSGQSQDGAGASHGVDFGRRAAVRQSAIRGRYFPDLSVRRRCGDQEDGNSTLNFSRIGQEMVVQDSSGDDGEAAVVERLFPPLRETEQPERRSVQLWPAVNQNPVEELVAPVALMEVEVETTPAISVSPVVVARRTFQDSRRSEAGVGNQMSPRPRNRSGQQVQEGSPVSMGPVVLNADVNMTSEEDSDDPERILRSFGRGVSSSRRGRPAPRSGLGSRGRGRQMSQLEQRMVDGINAGLRYGVGRGNRLDADLTGAGPVIVGARGRDARSQSGAGGRATDSPTATSETNAGVEQRRQQERRASGRQRNANDEAGASASGLGGASINIEGRIRFIASDSSDDDVTDAILFHTFLPSGRGSDKSKRQN